ncbi:MAG: radical SAM protein [Acidobacteria bacterium]|nr:radical SAM protein [Acidobacteriota bacterium]
MLEVTELVNVALGRAAPEGVAARAPARYAARVPAPPVVVWNVCRHCILRCPHCYAAATPTPSPYDLTTAEARRLIETLAQAGVRVLILSGGEPLLRQDLVELAAHARAVGLRPILSTSGVLLDGRMAAALAAAGISYVGISLDGLAPFNDAYRGMSGAFERAARGLACAKAAGMCVGVRMTVTRLNATHVEPLVEWAVARDVDRFYLSHLLYSGRGLKLACDDLHPEESRVLLGYVFETAERLVRDGASLRIVTGGNDSDGPYFLRWVWSRYGCSAAERVEAVLRRRGGNSAGERILAIDHRGHVHPDQFFTTRVLGDVRLQPFAEILAHPLREALRNREKLLEGRCGSCAYKSLCRGSHRERALARYGALWAPDPACVMTEWEIGVPPEECAVEAAEAEAREAVV